jgi:hypothetical protein
LAAILLLFGVVWMLHSCSQPSAYTIVTTLMIKNDSDRNLIIYLNESEQGELKSHSSNSFDFFKAPHPDYDYNNIKIEAKTSAGKLVYSFYGSTNDLKVMDWKITIKN